MILYILECIAFQLVFLIIYDLWLKGETFFQWNRLYLIGTYLLSLGLPWVKIEALKTTMPRQFRGYPEFLWKLDQPTLSVMPDGASILQITWQQGLFFGGMFMATLLFGYKILQLFRLRQQGQVHYLAEFTRVVIKNSNLAFSFLKSIFLGDRIAENELQSIIAHELVHIKQRHSWDLILFELMRIVGWFNPLVYIYQSRVSELHEFIADSHVAKTHKNEQYQLLLSQVFQTRNISFVNQFYKSSLTRLFGLDRILNFLGLGGQAKKRIIMLQKSRSKQIFQLKYLFLIPVVAAMLFYASCESEGREISGDAIVVGDIENLTATEEQFVFDKLIDLSGSTEDWHLYVKDENSTMKFVKSNDGSYITGPNNEKILAKLAIDSKFNKTMGKDLINNNPQLRYSLLLEERKRLLQNTDEKSEVIINLDQQLEVMKQQIIDMDPSTIAFGWVDEVPVFPGCENDADLRNCFQQSIQKHISKNFNYPQEAQEKGIQGRVNIMFMIAEDGAITDVKMRGPDKLLEAEAERIIAKLPRMQPGKQGGKPVKVPFSIPITFKLK
tara:strand:+ start:698 stop:2362 length:1665 start_codon:yes stop_codon:yes gene_type:complete